MGIPSNRKTDLPFGQVHGSNEDSQWLHVIDKLYELIEYSHPESIMAMLKLPSLKLWPQNWLDVFETLKAQINAAIIELSETRPVCTQLTLFASLSLGSESINFIARANSQAGFNTHQTKCFTDFFEHLQQGITIHLNVMEQQQSIKTMYQCLNHADVALALLDDQLQVVFRNHHWHVLQKADKLIVINEMLHQNIKPQETKVAYSNTHQEKWLKQITQFQMDTQRIQFCLNTPSQQLTFTKLDPSHHDLAIYGLKSLESYIQIESNLDSQPHILLTINETTAAINTDALIQPNNAIQASLFDCYELTEKEVLLAVNLCHGLSLKQFAFHCERSLETVRVQLKSIFKKMKVSDQKSLCQLIYNHLRHLNLAPMADWLTQDTLARQHFDSGIND